MRITQKYLRNRNACYDLITLEEYVFKGRKWVNHTTILKDKDITTVDKLWLILDLDFIEKKKLHLLACDYAEQIPQTKEALALIQSKRDWIAGKITGEELDKKRAAWWSADRSAYGSADRSACWTADRSADRSAYRSACWTAYRSADRSAYGAVGYEAEREWQLEQAIKVMKEE